MHARRSRKASAQPDVRGRGHDEVVHGDRRWKEAGHRSRWTVLYAHGRREAGTGRNSGTRPQPGQRMVLYRPAYHGRASGFSQGRAPGINQDLSNNQPYTTLYSSPDVATPLWVIPVARGGDRIKEEPAK